MLNLIARFGGIGDDDYDDDDFDDFDGLEDDGESAEPWTLNVFGYELPRVTLVCWGLALALCLAADPMMLPLVVLCAAAGIWVGRWIDSDHDDTDTNTKNDNIDNRSGT